MTLTPEEQDVRRWAVERAMGFNMLDRDPAQFERLAARLVEFITTGRFPPDQAMQVQMAQVQADEALRRHQNGAESEGAAP